MLDTQNRTVKTAARWALQIQQLESEMCYFCVSDRQGSIDHLAFSILSSGTSFCHPRRCKQPLAVSRQWINAEHGLQRFPLNELVSFINGSECQVFLASAVAQ